MLKNPQNFVEISGNWPLDDARAFCRKIARSHYENFVVASFFLPADLHQHYYNVYAYCRISDDLGDEIPDPEKALRMLDLWQKQLDECYSGNPRNPVFVALKDTIDTFGIPREPFIDLLDAFRLDQHKTRYETFDELLEYCRYSANPVGRLVLYLSGYRDDERQRLSDCTCTALQLANHWQDIDRDFTERNRIYLPREDTDRFRYMELDLRERICDRRFTALMAFEIERTRKIFQEGLALAGMVSGRLAVEVEMFGRSGLQLLGRIEDAGYDVFRRRPTLSKWNHLGILLRCWLRQKLATSHQEK